MNKKMFIIISVAFVVGLSAAANYISATTYEDKFDGPCDGTCTTSDSMATLNVQSDDTIVMDTGSTGYCGRAGVEEQWEVTGSGDELQIDVDWRGSTWAGLFAIVVNHDSGSEEIFSRNPGGSSDSYNGVVNYDIGQYSGQTVTIDYYFEDTSDRYCDMGDHDQDATISSTVVSTNTAPNSPSNPSPADNQDAVDNSTNLQVDVGDSEGDSMDVQFYLNGSLEGTDTGVCSGCTASINPSLSTGQSYNWYAVADDGQTTTTSSTWTFDTVHYPEFDQASAAPQSGAESSTSPELGVNVSHQDGLEMDVYFYLNGTFVGEQKVTGSGTATVDTGNLDPNQNYEWYVEVTDVNGRTVDNQASPWSFQTDAGDANISIDYGNNTNFGSGTAILDVIPGHSHAGTVDYVRLLDENGTQIDEVQNVDVNSPVSLLWEGLESDREYSWRAEVEHEGDLVQTSLASFTTLDVGINLTGSVSDAETYKVYRRTGSSGDTVNFDYGDGNYSLIGSDSTLNLIDGSSGLELGQSYCYVVTAENLGGESSGSDEVCTSGNLVLNP